jgi:hypothetical protein
MIHPGQSLLNYNKMAGTKLSRQTKTSKIPPSPQKIIDGSNFCPGNLALWHGYTRYNSNNQPALVILIKPIDNSNPLLNQLYEDTSELHWFCNFIDNPGDPILLKQSELSPIIP